MQRTQLINTLKQALRAQKLTYADVARRLRLSVASVKRIFSRGDVSLSRLEAICDLAGLELSELVERMAASEPLISELTPDQERELIGNPRLLLLCYLLVNHWEVSEITKYFEVDTAEAKKLLRRLRDLNLIEILPFDRIKVLTARNFNWRPDGPVQRYFLEQVQRDFFNARFDQATEARYLLAGLLSETSCRHLVRGIRRLAAEIDELSKHDANLPRDEREPYGAVIALRHWEFSAFRALRRTEAVAAPTARRRQP